MGDKVENLRRQIAEEKIKLLKMYEAKGCIDHDILKQSVRIDKLINQYQKIIGKSDNLHKRNLND